jgi:hypothetical protein
LVLFIMCIDVRTMSIVVFAMLFDAIE